MGGEFGEHTARVTRRGFLPRFLALGQFLRGHVEGEGAFLGVENDFVAVLHEGDRAADVGFRRDVADDEAVAAAAEASVGDERDVFAEAFAHDGAGGRKHFAHARSALRSLAANDDDVAFLDRAVEDRFQRLLFALEHDGFAFETQTFLAGDLADCASGSEVAVEDDEVTVLFDRVVERADDLLALRIRFHVRQRLGHGFAGDGEAIAVEQAGVEQRLHERADAADGDERAHAVFAAGLEVGEHGHAFADAREVVNGQLHLRGVRDGEQVQHRIGRTAERDDDGDGVLKRFLREDVEGLEAHAQHVYDGRTGAAAIVELRGGNGVLRGAVRQAHAERFDRAGHRVRGIHAAA